MCGSAMLTTVASMKAMPVPSTVAKRTHRPAASPYRTTGQSYGTNRGFPACAGRARFGSQASTLWRHHMSYGYPAPQGYNAYSGYGTPYPVRRSAPASIHTVAIIQYIGGLLALAMAALLAVVAFGGGGRFSGR